MIRIATAVQRPDGHPLDATGLAPAELRLADGRRPSRRDHFKLGRQAARGAIGHLEDGEGRAPEILADTNGAPVAMQSGRRLPVGVSIAHSGRVALAAAWPTHGRVAGQVGVDIERRRPTDIAHSPYAFTPAETAVLLGSGWCGDSSMAGIAGWVTKEAAWKTLGVDRTVGPEVLEIERMDRRSGWARLRTNMSGGGTTVTVRLRGIAGPDGDYIAGVAVRQAGEMARRWLSEMAWPNGECEEAQS